MGFVNGSYSLKQFWDGAGWGNMGTHDLPAIIGKVVAVRSSEQEQQQVSSAAPADKMLYIGHSEGTTQFFASVGSQQAVDVLNEHIAFGVMLSPPMRMTGMGCPIFRDLADNDIIPQALFHLLESDQLKLFELFNTTAQSERFHNLLGSLCDDLGADGAVRKLDHAIASNPILNKIVPEKIRQDVLAAFNRTVCTSAFHFCFDGWFPDWKEHPADDVTKFDLLFKYVPSAQGWRNAMHYAQNIGNDGEFRQFDHFSFQKNAEAYGTGRMLYQCAFDSAEPDIHAKDKKKAHWWSKGHDGSRCRPPKYDIKRLKVPLALLSGSRDLLADRPDVEWLRRQLIDESKGESVNGSASNDILKFFHEMPHFGHLTYAIGTQDVMHDVFDDRIQGLFEKFGGEAGVRVLSKDTYSSTSGGEVEGDEEVVIV